MIRTIVRTLIVVSVFATLLESSGLAQSKNEVGLLLGGSIVPTSTTNLNINSGLAYQATYAYKFTGDGAVGFGFEVPFVAIPSQDVQSGSPFPHETMRPCSLHLVSGLYLCPTRQSLRGRVWVADMRGLLKALLLSPGRQTRLRQARTRAPYNMAAVWISKLPSTSRSLWCFAARYAISIQDSR